MAGNRAGLIAGRDGRNLSAARISTITARDYAFKFFISPGVFRGRGWVTALVYAQRVHFVPFPVVYFILFFFFIFSFSSSLLSRARKVTTTDKTKTRNVISATRIQYSIQYRADNGRARSQRIIFISGICIKSERGLALFPEWIIFAVGWRRYFARG